MQLAERLQLFFHAHANSDLAVGSVSALTMNEFHQKIMDIHLRRFTMFLHRDFMLRARVDPRFYLSRKTCVEAALVIVSSCKGVDLSLSTVRWSDSSKLALVGRGLFKCALSFDALLILALEVTTQLQDESAPQSEADALDKMARASRSPLIQSLERAEEQLAQLIAHGNTSFKRLLFIRAHLSQIRAMESGRPFKQAIYEAATKTLRECISMRNEHQTATTPQDLVETIDTFTTDFLPLDLFSAVNISQIKLQSSVWC